MNKSKWAILVPILQSLWLNMVQLTKVSPLAQNETTSQFRCWNSGLQQHSLFVCCAWLVPRTPLRLFHIFLWGNCSRKSPVSSITNMMMPKYQDVPQPFWFSCSSPSHCCLLWHQLSFDRYMRSWWDRKNAVFWGSWLSNQPCHTDNPLPVPNQHRAQNYTEPAWVKCETMLARKMHFSRDMTEFMTTK